MTALRTLARRRQLQRRRHAQTARQAFYIRGERAWQQYLHTGRARTEAEVFAQIDARIDAGRRQLGDTARREGLAALDQLAAIHWEPPRIEIGLRPAELGDGP